MLMSESHGVSFVTFKKDLNEVLLDRSLLGSTLGDDAVYHVVELLRLRWRYEWKVFDERELGINCCSLQAIMEEILELLVV